MGLLFFKVPGMRFLGRSSTSFYFKSEHFKFGIQMCTNCSCKTNLSLIVQGFIRRKPHGILTALHLLHKTPHKIVSTSLLHNFFSTCLCIAQMDSTQGTAQNAPWCLCKCLRHRLYIMSLICMGLSKSLSLPMCSARKLHDDLESIFSDKFNSYPRCRISFLCLMLILPMWLTPRAKYWTIIC